MQKFQIILLGLILLSQPVWAQEPLKELKAQKLANGRLISLQDLAFADYLEGKKLKSAERNEEALDAFSRALSKDPQLGLAYFERAELYTQKKEAKKALEDYSAAIQNAHKTFLDEAHFKRGQLYHTFFKKHEEAIQDFNTLIKVNPKNTEALLARGKAYGSLKKWDLALADYSRALKESPNSAKAYSHRGEASIALKQYDEALQDFSKALSLDPGFAPAFYNKGLIYTLQKQYEQALESYTHAIEAKPDYAEAYHNKGYIYNDVRKNYPKALQNFNKALKINPNYADAYYNRGLTYYYMKLWKKSAADFSKAIEHNPKDADALYYRGECHYNLNLVDKAISDFEQVVSISPKDAWTYFLLSSLYAFKRQNQKSLDMLKQAIKYDETLKAEAEAEPSLVLIRKMPEYAKLVQ